MAKQAEIGLLEAVIIGRVQQEGRFQSAMNDGDPCGVGSNLRYNPLAMNLVAIVPGR
ncbi:hypothetical protein [Hypericibacter sp.]|uniref:hypothetical protein n=1 Tax=Hypericibacter sp. TaxID=2705401 RepID=UPI003D6D7FC0